MFIVESYSLAIVFCFVTMLCWGSWGNTQKLAQKSWRYELFYWDYVIGMVLAALLLVLARFGGDTVQKLLLAVGSHSHRYRRRPAGGQWHPDRPGHRHWGGLPVAYRHPLWRDVAPGAGHLCRHRPGGGYRRKRYGHP